MTIRKFCIGKWSQIERQLSMRLNALSLDCLGVDPNSSISQLGELLNLSMTKFLIPYKGSNTALKTHRMIYEEYMR